MRYLTSILVSDRNFDLFGIEGHVRACASASLGIQLLVEGYRPYPDEATPRRRIYCIRRNGEIFGPGELTTVVDGTFVCATADLRYAVYDLTEELHQAEDEGADLGVPVLN